MMTENMNDEQRDELLMDEASILEGMLEAADFKEKEEYQRKLEIIRDVITMDEVTGEKIKQKKKFFEFMIRPLDESELDTCFKKASKYVPSTRNKNIRERSDVDMPLLKSNKIYLATIGEMGKKIWDNKVLKDKFNTKNPLDVISELLMAGEKDFIDDVIDEISGFTNDREEMLKK